MEETMISADALRKQIAKTKRCFTSENSDYMTGYLSALSMVEGLIAYLEPKKENVVPCGGYFDYYDKTESGLLEDD